METEKAHAIVGASMLTTFLVVLIAQNWFKHIRDWVEEQTHQGFKATPDPNVPNRTTPIHWLVGLGGTWIILSLLAESEDTAEVAAGFAGLIAFGVIIKFGADAMNNLQGAAGVAKGGGFTNQPPFIQQSYFNPPGTDISVEIPYGS